MIIDILGYLWDTEIKKRNFKSIAVTQIPNIELGRAINDRLIKASNK